MSAAPRAADRILRPLLIAFAVAALGLAASILVDDASAADPSASPAPAEASPGTSVEPSAAPSLTLAGQDGCVTCHARIDNEQYELAAQWQNSIHGQSGIGCAGCHGGDPTSDQVTVGMSAEAGYIGTPDRTATVKVCGECHADVTKMRQYQVPTDQLAKYESSVHGQRLLNAKDTRVAICTDCHGIHDVKKASDPTSPVFPLNVPKLCSSCHADKDLMRPYDIPTDQFDVYSQSVHGTALLEDQDMRAPTCASCHGSHDAKPPQSSEVVDVCGKCHTATQELYEQSRHAQLAVGPKCWTCHGTHDVVKPDESRFLHLEPPDADCTVCHNPGDRTLILSRDRFTDDNDRRCDTCHHAGSILYTQSEGIRNALEEADDAYKSAEQRIAEAAGAGMIVSDADVTLSEALTGLIRGRAESHTTKLSAVAALTDEAKAKADEARALAEDKLLESTSRRQAMVIVVAIIVVNVLALMILRRGLHGKADSGPSS